MSSRNVPSLTTQYRPYWCMCRTLHVFPKGRSLAPWFRFKKACFLSSQQEGLPLSAHYWTHLFLSCSWVFFRGIFIETKGALFWFGLLYLLPIGLELKCVTQQVMSYPLTLILFKFHFLCPCNSSQMLYGTKCYWIRRNILNKLKRLCRNWVCGTDPFSLLPQWLRL